jgi:transaldolase
VQQPDYAPLLAETVAVHRARRWTPSSTRCWCASGCEILKVVPGRVSTEVDARLSFDTAATVARARRSDRAVRSRRHRRDRVLIKIAATWEGIRAAEQLEREGIHCNLTLLFAFCQAVACGDAGVQLISPFVGRIYDWHKKAAGAPGTKPRAGANDPGVQSVRAIYNHYKRHGIATEVMGASFRNVGPDHRAGRLRPADHQPRAAGAAAGQRGAAARALDADAARAWTCRPCTYDEEGFRWALNDDAMATEKLAEGIRAFAADAGKLDR